MAGFPGRDMLLAQADSANGSSYTTVAGLRNTGVRIGQAIVDITTKDDAGVRQLLNSKVLQEVSVSADGVVQDSTTLKTLRDAAAAGLNYNFRLTTAGDATAGVTMTGPFVITEFNETSPYDGECSFSCTLQSAGTITIAAKT
jgi:TP901-1 family phage major tail protein